MQVIAITGASGHIGAALVRQLIDEGKTVKALVHRQVASLQGLPVEKVPGDARDAAVMGRLVQDADLLINLAAKISIWKKDAASVLAQNTEITRQTIQACLSTPQPLPLIHFSSIHSLQVEPRDEPLDEQRPWVGDDGTAYEKSKVLGEQMVLEAVHHQGLQAVMINPTSVMGPYDFYPSLLGQALISMYRRRLPFLMQGGYDFVDVRDVALATSRLINRFQAFSPGEKFILSGRYQTLRELSGLVNAVKGSAFPFVMVPPGVAKAVQPLVSAFSTLTGKPPLYTRESIDILATGHTRISQAKATRYLDFTPRPIADTVRDTLQWFKNQSFMQ